MLTFYQKKTSYVSQRYRSYFFSFFFFVLLLKKSTLAKKYVFDIFLGIIKSMR